MWGGIYLFGLAERRINRVFKLLLATRTKIFPANFYGTTDVILRIEKGNTRNVYSTVQAHATKATWKDRTAGSSHALEQCGTSLLSKEC